MAEDRLSADLSAGGRERLLRVRDVLGRSLAQRRRQSLRRWVEGTWLALGGPACLARQADLADARVFLDLLEGLEQGGDLEDPTRLAEEAARLYARPDTEADAGLQVMTIHKAKGLEFDTVIVPGLGRKPRRDDTRLLLWLERPRGTGAESELLLAPIKASGQDSDPIYRYVQGLDQQKGLYEDGRLLYVAATRARSRLHLLGHTGYKAEDDGLVLRPPANGALLGRLWPVVEPLFQAAVDGADEGSSEIGWGPELTAMTGISRLPDGWTAPPVPPAVIWRAAEAPAEETFAEVEFTWARETIRHVGTVVHRALQGIAREGPAAWGEGRVQASEAAWRAALAGLGVPPSQLETATERVLRAVTQTLEDARGRWILDPGHEEARSEYGLSGLHEGRVVHVVIDRSFVDGDGVRWIIDYKTSTHEGADQAGFLDNEQIRYQEQLERYGALMARRDARPIRLGLYFPLLKGWREWDVGG